MNKVALVTGASKGIGKVIALKLAEIGFDLMLVGRDESQLIATKNEVEKHNVKCAYTEADLSSADAPALIIREVIRDLGDWMW